MSQETLLSERLEQFQAPQSPAPPSPFPLRLGTAAEFAALRQFFEGAKYTEAGICERGNCPTVPDLAVPDNDDDRPILDPLDVLLRLFLHGERLPLAEVREHLSSGMDLL